MAHVRSYVLARPCEFCNRSFRPRMDAFKKNRGRFCSIVCANSKNPFDHQKAINLYQGGMTLEETGKFLNVNWKRIRRCLANAKIEIRPASRRPAKHSAARYRKVAAKKIGRPLKPGETVHHINCNDEDDSPENILVLPNKKVHGLLHRKLELMAQELVAAKLILFNGDTYVFSSEMERFLNGR